MAFDVGDSTWDAIRDDFGGVGRGDGNVEFARDRVNRGAIHVRDRDETSARDSRCEIPRVHAP